MDTKIEKHRWVMRSVSYWLTLSLALGIIFIGARFILQPQVGAEGYGIPFNDMHDIGYGRIKGIRDIVSGLVLLPLLGLRMIRATAWVFTAAIITPLADFLTVLSTNGGNDIQHLSIHGITALIMVVNSILLFRTARHSTKA